MIEIENRESSQIRPRSVFSSDGDTPSDDPTEGLAGGGEMFATKCGYLALASNYDCMTVSDLFISIYNGVDGSASVVFDLAH